MAMDGLTLLAAVSEIRGLVGGKIDRINQPEKDEIVLFIRKDSANYMLLLSASPMHCRAQITQRKRINPIEAPMFCMLLRKRIAGGKLIAVEQDNLDRVVKLKIEAVDELGDDTVYTLACEIMGKYSNIVLVSAAGTVIDAIKRVTLGMSNVRLIMPGCQYTDAPTQDKMNPMNASAEDVMCALSKPGRADKALSAAFFGLAPSMAHELINKVCDANDTDLLTLSQKEDIARCFVNFYTDAANNVFHTCLMLDEYGSALGVCPFIPNRQYVKQTDSIHAALDEYYERFDTRERMTRRSSAVRKVLQNNIERCEKKLAMYNETLASSSETEKLRLYGELITANLYTMKQGACEAVLLNYYEEPPIPVTIPLEVRLTPNENAQRYYKLYQKAKATRDMAVIRRVSTLKELEYLEGQLDNLTKCTTDTELTELTEELKNEGYVKRDKGRAKQKKLPPSKPMCFKSSDGALVYVGKNNRQNDELTLHFASGDDIWMHTKDIPGSHVIVKCTGEPSKATLLEAALLAAYFSKARGGENTAVDFTARKNVKKPGGSKPGMVIYTTNRTAYVTPDDESIKPILARQIQ